MGAAAEVKGDDAPPAIRMTAARDFRPFEQRD